MSEASSEKNTEQLTLADEMLLLPFIKLAS